MYYLQSRYYNPEWGRFINADALVGQTGQLLSHNMFAYCANDPINSVDDTGYAHVKIDENRGGGGSTGGNSGSGSVRSGTTIPPTIKPSNFRGSYTVVKGSLPKLGSVVNRKGVSYPSAIVDGYGKVPFPKGLYVPNNSEALRPQFTDAFKKQFKEWWIQQGRPWPQGEVNIHHIKPLSKGGDNSFENLVPLIQPLQHQPFTNWWRSYP